MISFTSADMDRFLAEDDGLPVTMLNLARFQPGEGRSLYLEYLRLAQPIASRHGAEIIYAGDGLTALAAEDGQSWDVVALVRYPSRRAFADLVADPEYQTADAVRQSALLEAVLQPLRDMTG